MTKIMYMTHGLPGSGKTYEAFQISKKHNNAPVFSTDDFFTNPENGEYLWEYKFISVAHKWNLGMVAHAMYNGADVVIVANTGLKAWEYLPYAELAADCGYELHIVEPKTKWKNDVEKCFEKNVHKVPLATIERMAKDREKVSEIKKTIEQKMHSLGKEIVVV